MEKNRKQGILSDNLTDREVTFTKKAAESLSNVDWARKLLKSNKIARALAVTPNRNRSYDDTNEIKSALFEVRFAYAIYKAGLNAEYEFSSNMKGSTVDFKVIGNTNWLIELTSLRESSAVKDNTKTENEYFEFISRTKAGAENSPEIRDLIKLQSAICCKISDSKTPNKIGNPIKFPEIKPNLYQMILVDVRSFMGVGGDFYDWFNVAYGSKKLASLDQGIHCRYLKDNEGKISLIKGLFEEDHPDLRSQHIRDRIHALAFISEKKYDENEIITNMCLFPNPAYFEENESFIKIFPFKRDC